MIQREYTLEIRPNHKGGEVRREQLSNYHIDQTSRYYFYTSDSTPFCFCSYIYSIGISHSLE